MKVIASLLLFFTTTAFAQTDSELKFALYEATCKGKVDTRMSPDEQKELSDLAAGIQQFSREPQRMLEDLRRDASGTFVMIALCSGLLEVRQLAASETSACVGPDGKKIDFTEAAKLCLGSFKNK